MILRLRSRHFGRLQVELPPQKGNCLVSPKDYEKKTPLAVGISVLAILIASCTQDDIQTVTIGTGGHDGTYQIVGHAISRTVNKDLEKHQIRIQDMTSSGSISNISAIVAGDIEFGIAQADHQHQAVNGLAAWQKQGPQNDLRAVFSLYTEPVTLVAGGDTQINTIDDLMGRRVDIGTPGSGTRQNAIDVLSAAGIDWTTDIDAIEGNLDERLATFMHGGLDAFFYTVGHPNMHIKFATYSVRGARIIPLANIEQIVSTSPYYMKTFIPVDLYPQAKNSQDVETIGVKAILLTSANVPDEIVYTVTKAVLEDLESLREIGPVFMSFGPAGLLGGVTAPIHSGALRYFEEAGIQIPPSSLQ